MLEIPFPKHLEPYMKMNDIELVTIILTQSPGWQAARHYLVGYRLLEYMRAAASPYRQALERYGYEVEDLFQDVLLDEFRKGFPILQRWDPERAKLSTLLWRIVAYRCVDKIRRLKRRSAKEVGSLDEPWDDENEAASWVELLGPPQLPIPDEVSRRDEILRMRHCVSMLDPEYELIISLYYYAKLTEEEVGHIIGKSRNQVSYLRRQALKKLRPCMDGGPADVDRVMGGY